MLVEFSLKRVGKIFKFSEYKSLVNALIPVTFTHTPPHSKLTPTVLSSQYRQKEFFHFPRQNFFEILFFRTVESGGGNYDFLHQNSVRKNEDDLEHYVFYILRDFQFFQMLYSFVNNIYYIVWY